MKFLVILLGFKGWSFYLLPYLVLLRNFDLLVHHTLSEGLGVVAFSQNGFFCLRTDQYLVLAFGVVMEESVRESAL